MELTESRLEVGRVTAHVFPPTCGATSVFIGKGSPLYLVWVPAPHGAHVKQAKFRLQMCPVVFLRVLPFSPHLLIYPSHMS